MDNSTHVITYKCPCCNAGLSFSGSEQKPTCEYCENTFATNGQTGKQGGLAAAEV